MLLKKITTETQRHREELELETLLIEKGGQ
jgi:hypothetical protein